MVVELAMEFAGDGRRAARRYDAGGFGWLPTPEDELYQQFRH